MPASIHDAFRVKEPGLADRLVYDAYERRSGLVRVLAPDTIAGGTGRGREPTELGDAVDGAFTIVDLGPDRLTTRREATIAGATGDHHQVGRPGRRPADAQRSSSRSSWSIGPARRSMSGSASSGR